MFLNLFGSNNPPGAHAGDYRNRFSISMLRSNRSLPHCDTLPASRLPHYTRYTRYR
jgi:hypothetical protein